MAVEAFGVNVTEGKEVFGPNLLPILVIGEVFGPMYSDGAEVFGPIVETPEIVPDVITTSRIGSLPVRTSVISLRRVR